MLGQDPSSAILTNIARHQATQARTDPLGKLAFIWSRIKHRYWMLMTASEINPRARIDQSVIFPHPIGIVIHGAAIIEADCIIMQQVTVGQTNTPGAPHIEHGVFIGAGAKILGPIRIGTGAAIGANAVVLKDVPPGATAVGVPARIIER